MSFGELFQRWQQTYHFHAFICDGIVDVERYEMPHILYVLRDMNCQTGRDLCDDLRKDGSGWKTWSNVGRWTAALLDGHTEYPTNMSSSNRAAQLRRVAVMNLKKEGGVARTNGNKLLDAVREQNALIFEEICLCTPCIIICCGLTASGIVGNAALLKDYVFPVSSDWKSFRSASFDREWWYYYTEINGNRVPVISFCHPQVTNLEGNRGHEKLFAPLYRDMLLIRQMFLSRKDDDSYGSV